jgi:hypothetical protein
MKKINYSAKNIRIFLMLLTVLSAFILWRGFKGVENLLKIKILVAIAAFALFFIILPRLFVTAYKVIMIVSGFIGNTIFLIIATTVFFMILTPLALIMRLFGKVFMTSHYDKSAVSYFENPQAVQGYDKQY